MGLAPTIAHCMATTVLELAHGARDSASGSGCFSVPGYGPTSRWDAGNDGVGADSGRGSAQGIGAVGWHPHGRKGCLTWWRHIVGPL